MGKNAHGIIYYVGVVNVISGVYEERLKTTNYEDAFDLWSSMTSHNDTWEIWLTNDMGMKKVR